MTMMAIPERSLQAVFRTAALQGRRLLLNGYVMAILWSLAMWAVLNLMLPIFSGAPPLLLFLVGVMVATWFGGFGPGFLATLLSVFMSVDLLVRPGGSLPVDYREQLRVLLFVCVGGLLSLMISVLRKKQMQMLREVTQQKELLEQEVARRQDAERALRSVHSQCVIEKNQLDAVMESLPVGVAIIDAEGGCIRHNRAFERVWGCSDPPKTNCVEDYKSYKGWWLESGKPLLPEEWASARAVRNGETVVGQLIKIARFDGSEAFVHNSAAPILDDSGGVGGSAVAIMDITERITHEQALRESEERFNAFMNNSPMIAWIKDDQGRHVYLNKSYEKHFGVRMDDWRGKTDFDVWPRETAERFWKNDQVVLARDEAVEMVEETPIREGQGRFWWNFKFPIQDALGNRYVGGVGIDITARKRAEQALEKAKQELEQRMADWERAEKKRLELETALAKIVSTAPGVICSYRRKPDGTDCFPYASPAIQEIYGISPEELKESAEPIYALIHPDDSRHVTDTIAESAGSLTPWHCEFRVRNPAKGEIWVEGHSIPEQEPDGGIVWHGFIHDVTQRKLAEASLMEADQRKNEFLAMLGHELRNPLAPIRNAVHILKQQADAASSAEWCLNVIDRHVTHLSRLIDDLLDIARIMQGKVRLKLERFELLEILNSAIESCRPLMEARRQELSITYSSPPQWIDGDRVRLVQVVSNLLQNASKYTQEGGTIELSATKEGTFGVIGVRDNGIGISREMLPHIFDLFTQADRALAHSQEGLGIGLTLARRLVEMHGGTIGASSEGVGRGSEFTVRLPLSPEQPVDPQASQSRPLPAASLKLRIFVVDDNRDAAESLALLLQTYGHEVDTADCGLKAVELAPKFHPQVVLLDIGLPDLDGFEVAQRLRQIPETRHALMIALTGYGQPEDLDRSRAAGIDHHLLKPVDLDALFGLLATLSGKSPSEAV